MEWHSEQREGLIGYIWHWGVVQGNSTKTHESSSVNPDTAGG